MKKEELLKKYFGYSQFRQGQDTVIDQITAGRDVMAVMPTGAGKSLCYQIPALMMPGITVVVSPLISLMKDQIRALIDAGIRAAYINSSLSLKQQALALRNAARGDYKIIYVAPERLSSAEFLQFAQNTEIALLAIDEAHCISQWGQDFRPSYLKITEFVSQLPKRPVICAFTATATLPVREDIVRILTLNDPYQITTGYDRGNLYFEVQKPKDKMEALLPILKRYQDRSGIIYCSTRKNVEQVCSDLLAENIPATRYHAGLDDAERAANQEDFLYDRKRVMVATNAFGMGIDKSDVSFVVHYNMPKDLESYYQEAGRGGRDGSDAECILLYSGQDVKTNEFLIKSGKETPELSAAEIESVTKNAMERLKKITYYCNTTKCLRQYILDYFGETHQEYCGNCSNCNTYFTPIDITMDAQKIISCVGRLNQQNRKFGKNAIVDILYGSKSELITRLQLDNLSTYGIMHDKPKMMIRKIIDNLIDNDFLELSDDEFTVVKYGFRYKEIVYENKHIDMFVPEKSDMFKFELHNTMSNDSSYPLLLELKKLRAGLASELKLPAYIVFTDAALQDMCDKLPKSIEEFGRIKGVGTKKQEQYGKQFVDVILEHVNKQPEFIKSNNEKAKDYQINARVIHRSFGIGQIVFNDGEYASIKFEGQADIKKFNIKMCIQKDLIQIVKS